MSKNKVSPKTDNKVLNSSEEENVKIDPENDTEVVNIDENGNLFSVNQGKESEVPLLDVRKELFDENNINRERLISNPNYPSL